MRITILTTIITMIISGCNNHPETKTTSGTSANSIPIEVQNKENNKDSIAGYAMVNGLKMYYEIHGSGFPLVLIHGGGSTIRSTFGQVLDSFAKDRQVVAVELQAHGRTSDRNQNLSFEQDADDVAALLKNLKIENADFLGFSNGGNTALQIAIRHPALVRKLIIASAFYKRDGLYPQFWESMMKATFENMPQALKDAYVAVAPDPGGLAIMCNKEIKRMLNFQDWRKEDIRSIKSPVLIIIGDADIVRPEHAVEMFHLLRNAHLAILPGGHGTYIGELTAPKEGSKLPDLTVAMVEEFLRESMPG